MENLLYSSAIQIAAAIAKKEISPVEVMQASLERMTATEPLLNCFVTPLPDEAMAAARAAERAVMSGEGLGPLHGVPISIKDLIAVGDVRITFGSRSMANNVAAADAPSVERVKAAGACIVGKTTTTEFGCKAAGDSPLSGTTRNPWNLSKTPGGSSLGAASSVAAGVTPFALGTDGGGSIRTPSAFTGLFGVKAQFGRVPVFPASSTPTLAHVGPLARVVRDAALLLQVVSGHDRRDPFSVSGPVPDYVAACDDGVKGMRIAWAPTLGYARPDPEIVSIAEKAIKMLEGLGCDVTLADDFIGDDPFDLWVSEFYAGVGTRLQSVLRGNPETLDPAVAEVLRPALGQSLEAYYANVFRRYEFREKVRAKFEPIDLLLTLTTPVTAFDVEIDVPRDLVDKNIISWQYYTYPFNLTGQPAASIPVGFTSAGMPVGLQLVAKINSEVDIFRCAAALESALPWAQVKPPFPI